MSKQVPLNRIFREWDPHGEATATVQQILQSAVAPRPVALVSTVNAQGEVNLSPFSFFNVFSADPPVLIFSPARRVRDGSTKHTLDNVMEVPEAVVQVVPYALVEQVSLASAEYPSGVNEFTKAGLTALPSKRVQPPRVAESPVQFECKVLEVKPLGQNGGAGNLVICEVIYAHLAEDVLDANGVPDPRALDPVARLGGDWYSRAAGALFEVPKPNRHCGMGVDALPAWLQQQPGITGNLLGRLGNLSAPPDASKILEAQERFRALHPQGSFPLRAGDPGCTVLFQQILQLAEKGALDEALALAFVPVGDAS